MSCGGGSGKFGKCSEKDVDPLRRFACPDSASGMCDKDGNPAEPLTEEQFEFLSCCVCSETGSPSCKECSDKGF